MIIMVINTVIFFTLIFLIEFFFFLFQDSDLLRGSIFFFQFFKYKPGIS